MIPQIDVGFVTITTAYLTTAYYRPRRHDLRFYSYFLIRLTIFFLSKLLNDFITSALFGFQSVSTAAV